jgi:hypothetical protein
MVRISAETKLLSSVHPILCRNKYLKLRHAFLLPYLFKSFIISRSLDTWDKTCQSKHNNMENIVLLRMSHCCVLTETDWRRSLDTWDKMCQSKLNNMTYIVLLRMSHCCVLTDILSHVLYKHFGMENINFRSLEPTSWVTDNLIKYSIKNNNIPVLSNRPICYATEKSGL